MDDHSMDEALDFSVLSLHSTEERLQMTFDQSLNIRENDNIHDHKQLHQQLEQAHATAEDNTDSGPWAKLPSTFTEMNPYQPGMNAQKLDAMAMDPNHVFKCSSISFPLTEPTTTSSSKEDSDKAPGADKEDQIPDWMLADPEMVPDWMRNADSASAAAEAEVLDWSSSAPDLSTTVDANSLFGFSSHPTFEALAISGAIASELQRRQSEDESASGLISTTTLTTSSTKTREGGFARFGNTIRGDGTIASTFGSSKGRRGSASEQGLSSKSGGEGSTPWQTGSGSSWQTWRTNNAPMEVEVDIEDDYDDHFNSQPTIEATPGFAPAQFRRDSA
ncbi:hypothetical protein BG006_006402 [Podila minutissima]|uniref:Uncharacterized protein n=1 Tax=Podila minutissima TaxID=64525 RepID=A0A9P5VLN2_9FUNG|nr:hypothetical protein BG006_006402 [Podila minutissima]